MDCLKASLPGLFLWRYQKETPLPVESRLSAPWRQLLTCEQMAARKFGVRAQLLSRGPLAAPTTQGGPPFFLIAAGTNAANFRVIAKAQ